MLRYNCIILFILCFVMIIILNYIMSLEKFLEIRRSTLRYDFIINL